MFFRLPNRPLAFEIPDEWLREAGAVGFAPARSTYRNGIVAVESEIMVPLREIAPAMRASGVTRDHHGFRRQGNAYGNGPGGMVNVLSAIVGGLHLPPVQVRPLQDASSLGFRYALRDGHHRFYASHVLGFSHIPCLVDQEVAG